MSAATPFARSFARLQALRSPYVGVVREVVELLAACDDARLFHVVALASESSVLDGDRLSGGAGGGGYGAVRDRAVAAALGEAIERYSAAHVPDEQLVLATAAELGADAPAPERFALFAAEQYRRPGFPFVPFTDSTPVRWVSGRAVADGRVVRLPAQLVYLPWARLAPGEAPIGYSTSSGLACGATWDEALLAALLELVERDAFMITWYARLSLPRLDWSDDAELHAFDDRHLAPTRLRHEVVDLSGFLDVPTALAVVHADGRGRGELGVGAASAPTVQEAWRKSLAEAYSVRSSARTLVGLNPDRVFRPDFADVAAFDDHIHLYGFRAHARRAAFLDASPERRSVADVAPLEGAAPADRVAAIVRRLDAAGLEAFAVDVTSADVRDAGLHVARAVVPGLCPLDVRHDARYLGARRLREVPFRLGLRPAPLRFDELNPDPHPFP